MNSLRSKVVSVALSIATVLTLAPFAAHATHSIGTNVNASGTVWMIRDNGSGGMCRQAYTSAGAFLSYGFNSWAGVVNADAGDLALSVCAQNFIPPQDGSIITSDRDDSVAVKGTTYIISAGKKIGVTDPVTFAALGYKFSNGTVGDVSWMQSGGTLNSGTQQHPVGTIVMNGGTAQYVGATSLLGFPTEQVFFSWGYTYAKTVPSNVADRQLPQAGIVQMRQAGQLSPEFGGPVLPPSGSVTVSTSVNTPAAATVPLGATNVKFLIFNVTGGSSGGTINQITVHRSGAGATTDISNLYLYQGSQRLTSGRSINSSTNDAVFSGLNISVPANGSVVLEVVGEISATGGAGNVHTMSVNNVQLSGSVTASGSATGNAMTLASVTAGAITIAKSGALTNPKVGQMNAKIGEFQLSASSAEDLTVRRITLFNSGSINRSYLTNFKLMQGGAQIASAASVDSRDQITFELNNYTLEKGNSRTFEVYADVSGQARTNDTIRLSVEENTDVFAQGKTFGFGATVTRTLYDNSAGNGTDASWTTVEGGQLTVAFNGPAAKDVAKNAKDVEMFNFTLTAQSNIEVRNLRLRVDGTDLICTTGGDGCSVATANLTDIKVTDTTTNQVVWGPQDLAVGGSDTQQDLTFTEDVILAAGSSHTYKVTADVGNNAGQADGETFTMTLLAFSAGTDLKNVGNNTFLAATDVVPTGNIAGNTMTTRISGLTVSLAGTPTSSSFVKGSSNVPAAGLNFAASTAQQVRVTSITLTCIIDTDGTPFSGTGAVGVEVRNCSDNVLSVRLLDTANGNAQVGTTQSPAATTGLVQFTGLNWVIPAGNTRTLLVMISLSNSATATDDVKFGIAAAGVTAVDQDGNSIAVSGLPVNQDTNMANGVTVAISASGTLSMAAAPTELDVTDSRIVAAGASGVTLAKVKFTAASEELKVTKLRVRLVSVAATAIVSDDVTTVSLYDGNTLVAGPVTLDPACATGTLHACADFNNIGIAGGASADFVIPKDGNKNLTVKGNTNAISTGADSGDEFRVEIDDNVNFEARGTSGNTVLTAASPAGDVLGNFVVLRKSQPKVELVALPSTTLGGGTQVLQKFKVTAMDGDVAVKHFTFEISNSDATLTLSNLALRESGAGSSYATTSSQSGTTTITVLMTLNSEVQVTSGGSKTFEFRADVGGTVGAADSLASKLLGDTAAVTGEMDALLAAQRIDDLDDVLLVGNVTDEDAAYNFIWSDVSGSGTGNPAHNDTPDGADDTDQAGSSNDWTNGRLIKVVPSDTQTMTFPS